MAPKYLITVPVVVSLRVEVDTDEEIASINQAHQLALERLRQSDGFHRLVVLDESGKECQCVELGDLEMPVEITAGNANHVYWIAPIGNWKGDDES